MTTRKQVNVSEISPSCARCSTGDSSNGLLCEHHGQGVTPHSELAAQQAWNDDVHGGGCDWVTHVHVNVELRLRREQSSPHGDAHARIRVLVPDPGHPSCLVVEHDTVIEGEVRDLDDRATDRGG